MDLMSILERVLMRRDLFRATMATMVKVVSPFCPREDVFDMGKGFMKFVGVIVTLETMSTFLRKA